MAEPHSESFNLPMDERMPFENSLPLLQGWPGYRTQPGRSGYDLIDTQLEMAHMTGIFLRQFFSGSWLHSNVGLHPWITLIVGIGLILAFPSPEAACPGIIVVLVIGLVEVIRNRRKISPDDEEADAPTDDEEADRDGGGV